jgi:hypothetical protein
VLLLALAAYVACTAALNSAIQSSPGLFGILMTPFVLLALISMILSFFSSSNNGDDNDRVRRKSDHIVSTHGLWLAGMYVGLAFIGIAFGLFCLVDRARTYWEKEKRQASGKVA